MLRLPVAGVSVCCSNDIRLPKSAYLRQHETCADPDGTGTKRQCGRQTLSVEDTSRSDDLHRLSCHGACLGLAQGFDCGDQYRCRYITSVSTTLAALCADEIRTESKALWHMLGVADHVHVEDAMLVQSVDDGLWRYTDSRDEKLSTTIDDNADELVELALGVVVAGGFVSA